MNNLSDIVSLGEEGTDLETSIGMQQLLLQMGKSYKQDKFSLKYKDESLE